MSYKQTKEIYRNALTVYLNMAIDNLSKWLNMEMSERHYIEKKFMRVDNIIKIIENI